MFSCRFVCSKRGSFVLSAALGRARENERIQWRQTPQTNTPRPLATLPGTDLTAGSALAERHHWRSFYTFVVYLTPVKIMLTQPPA